MDAEIGHSDQLYRFLGWLEVNWRRAAAIAAVIVVVGVIVAYFLWQGEEKEKTASQALSSLLMDENTLSADSLLQFAESHAGTKAGARATLLAAGRLFTDGKYAEALAQFQRFLEAASVPSLAAEARFGVASCKEALGETEAAIAGYKSLTEDAGSDNVLPQARFALARLYSVQGQTELARTQYELLASERNSSLAGEAQARLGELPPAPSIAAPAATEIGAGLSTTTNNP